ncbi:MAG: hypothetical protein ABIJ12_00280 [bacterium]
MIYILSVILLAALGIFGNFYINNNAEDVTDSNTAFYNGISADYVFNPPNGFIMEDKKVVGDGYSFALIPKGENYDSANVLIGVTIYNLTSNNGRFTYEEILTDDTASIRRQYGKKLAIWPVDSMLNFNGEIIPTYYFNHPDKFIPVVMISYYDAGSEMIIIDLGISDNFPRFKAEEKFDETLSRFKVLKHGELSKK